MFLIGNIQGRYFEHLDCLLTEDTLVQKYIEPPFLEMWSGIPKYAEFYQDTQNEPSAWVDLVISKIAFWNMSNCYPFLTLRSLGFA